MANRNSRTINAAFDAQRRSNGTTLVGTVHAIKTNYTGQTEPLYDVIIHDRRNETYGGNEGYIIRDCASAVPVQVGHRVFVIVVNGDLHQGGYITGFANVPRAQSLALNVNCPLSLNPSAETNTLFKNYSVDDNPSYDSTIERLLDDASNMLSRPELTRGELSGYTFGDAYDTTAIGNSSNDVVLTSLQMSFNMEINIVSVLESYLDLSGTRTEGIAAATFAVAAANATINDLTLTYAVHLNVGENVIFSNDGLNIDYLPYSVRTRPVLRASTLTSPSFSLSWIQALYNWLTGRDGALAVSQFISGSVNTTDVNSVAPPIKFTKTYNIPLEFIGERAAVSVWAYLRSHTYQGIRPYRSRLLALPTLTIREQGIGSAL